MKLKIGDVVRGKVGTLLEGYRGVVSGFSGGDPSEWPFINWIGKAYSASPTLTINPSCLEVEPLPLEARLARMERHVSTLCALLSGVAVNRALDENGRRIRDTIKAEIGE